MYKHVMVDLETLSSEKNACLLSIGAYAFNADAPDDGVDFYTTVTPESCTAAGLHISASTVLWWLQQSEAARQAVVAAHKGPSLSDALTAFAQWYTERAEGALVWGNGATFDNVVLDSAYKAAGIKRPWSYRSDACYRTLSKIFSDVPKPDSLPNEVAHHALDDAKWQARHLAAIFRAGNLA